MSLKIKDERICLSEHVEIDTADELRESLMHFSLGKSEIIVDLGQLEQIDTAAFQVLLAAWSEAESYGKSFRLTGVPAGVLQLADSLGVRLTCIQQAEQAHVDAA